MNTRSPLILRLSLMGLLAQIALGWPLWDDTARGFFPLVPLKGLPPVLQAPAWATVQTALTLLLPAAAIVFPRSRLLVWSLPVWFLWRIAQDLNRLQPWLFFYLLVWGALLCRGGVDGEQRAADRLLCWLLAAVYAWSGFNKLTPYFAVDNFPWFCTAFSWTQPLGQYPASGYGVALAELLFAPGLLWARTRPVFRWAVPVFHLFIALALSPAGLNWNTVVIPWNLAMAGMVWVMFDPVGVRRRGDGAQPGDAAPSAEGKVESTAEAPGRRVLFSAPPGLRREKFAAHGVAFGLFPRMGAALLLALAWFLPALNIAHRWPEALSWKMYSNTQPEATYYAADSGAPCPLLEPVWSRHAYDYHRKLLIDDWAFEVLHVPAYNSRYVFQQIAQYLCACSARPDGNGLLLLTVQRWDTTAEHWEQIPCPASAPKPPAH